MKNFLLGLSIATVVICGFLLLERDHPSKRTLSPSEVVADRPVSEMMGEGLQVDRHPARSEIQQRRQNEYARETALPTSVTLMKGQGEPKNSLFRDPRMRKAIEAEAKEGTEKNIKSLFKAGLAEQLHLDEAGS